MSPKWQKMVNRTTVRSTDFAKDFGAGDRTWTDDLLTYVVSLAIQPSMPPTSTTSTYVQLRPAAWPSDWPSRSRPAALMRNGRIGV